MATKNTEIKQETLFTKEQILASNKYADKKDVCNTVIPDNFHGTLNEVDVLIEKFMKGKVK
jgi:hypothetical protein